MSRVEGGGAESANSEPEFEPRGFAGTQTGALKSDQL